MGYEGEPIGTTSDGTEVRQLTDEEVAAAGGRERRYCLVGYSHWNPASFFGYYADELAKDACRYREAADIIARHRGDAVVEEHSPDLWQRDEAGRPVTPSGERIANLRSKLAGWHFAKESLSDGEREILAVTERFRVPLPLPGITGALAENLRHGVPRPNLVIFGRSAQAGRRLLARLQLDVGLRVGLGGELAAGGLALGLAGVCGR